MALLDARARQRALAVSGAHQPLQMGSRAPRGMCAAQVAALEAADEVDDVAARIGAANTLVRQPDGSLKARPRRRQAQSGQHPVQAEINEVAVHRSCEPALHTVPLARPLDNMYAMAEEAKTTKWLTALGDNERRPAQHHV